MVSGFGSGFDKKALARLDRKFERMPRAMIAAARKSLEASAGDITQAQKRLVPVNTGTLRDAIMFEMSPGETAGVAIFVNYTNSGAPKAPHAHLVEFGTAPHVIESDKPMGRSGQFGRRVQHPGTDPQPFFYPVYRIYRRRVKARLSRAAGKVARDIANGR